MELVLQILWWLGAVVGAVLAVLFAGSVVVTFCGRGPDHSSSALYKHIATFYDATSALWEDVWGDQMHHGHYGIDGKLKKDHVQAQIDMIDETLAFAGVDAAFIASRAAAGGVVRVLDAGCGVGGSSRHIARKFATHGIEVTGISLSPRQVASARARTEAAKLDDRVTFEVANAMESPFSDNYFDVVWSMESGEHMPDKAAFLAEIARVLKPGGRFAMATWCHRELDEARGPLSKSEKWHLKLLCHNYCLPRWVPPSVYEKAGRDCGMNDIVTDDWTAATLPFWPAVVKSALLPSSLLGLAKAGWLAVRGALTCVLMITGFRRELLVFAMFAARMPSGTVGRAAGRRNSGAAARGPRSSTPPAKGRGKKR